MSSARSDGDPNHPKMSQEDAQWERFCLSIDDAALPHRVIPQQCRDPADPGQDEALPSAE